jgi:hypothetical protein
MPKLLFSGRCLADLSFAIKRPDDTAFYCFRALESLRQSFGSDLREAEQWAAMAKAVGSSKADMQPLRDHAFRARHGAHRAITDEERQKFFLYTWETVEKYIDYRLVASARAPIFFPPTTETPDPSRSAAPVPPSQSP